MSGVQTKSLPLRIKSAGEPSPQQLAAIRGYTLSEVPAEKLYVRTFALAHNAVDRDRECFDDGLLADFARTLPGKGLFVKHPTSWQGDGGPGKGRWFEASVETLSLDEARALLREPGLVWPPGVSVAKVLMASAYLVRTNGNADLLDEIDAGIAGDVSIGFNAKDIERVTDGDGRELNVWRWKGPGEALEGSLVWLGAQPGARAVKAHQRDEESIVDKEEQLTAVKAENEQLKAQAEQGQKAAAALDALRKSLGDNATLIEQPDALAGLVVAGKAHRDSLVADIVRAERQLGLVGDDDAAVKAATDLHAGESFERLSQIHKHYGERAKGVRIPGADPNAGQAAPGKVPDALNSPALT